MIVLLSSIALVGFAFLVFDISTDGTYLVTISPGAIMATGIGGLFCGIANFKCYAIFFYKKEKWLFQKLLVGIGRTDKKVIADLGIFTTNKKDIELLKNCEEVKFVK